MRKKVLAVLVAIMATTAISVQAQRVNRGDFFFNTTPASTISNTAFSMRFTNGFALGLNAGGGYYIMDRLAIVGGASLGVDNSNWLFGLRGGARVSFLPVGPGIFFGETTLGFNYNNATKALFDLGVNIGYSLFFNDFVAVEPMLQLQVPFKKNYTPNFGLGLAFAVYF